jgi:hypothetical protein
LNRVLDLVEEHYLSSERNIWHRACHVARALRAISARGRRVYINPGGAPHDVFRTFDEATIDIVVEVVKEEHPWGW